PGNDPWFERIDAQPPVLARERQRRREDRLLRRRVRIAPASFEPPGFHSPRPLASTERNRPRRKPAIAAGLRSGSSTADATFTTSAPSRRCGNNSSVNKNVPKWFVANVESHPTEFCVACFCLTPALLNTPALWSLSATNSTTAHCPLAVSSRPSNPHTQGTPSLQM